MSASRSPSITIAVCLAASFLAGACSSGATVTPSSAGTITTTASGSPSRNSPNPPGSPTATPSRPAEATFHGTIAAIDGATRTRMASSWHPGCPVPIQDLRLLSLDYVGFDGRVHTGEMVVHHDVAKDVVEVFRRLFEAGFPIRRMRLVDDYGGDDDRSMAADNTSAFNCRRVTGGASWSEHAYGRAIDVNPIQNPYVTDAGTVEPPAGASFLDRSVRAKGVIRAGDAVVDAFASVGWEWGGSWSNPTDYQHFSATGR